MADSAGSEVAGPGTAFRFTTGTEIARVCNRRRRLGLAARSPGCGYRLQALAISRGSMIRYQRRRRAGTNMRRWLRYSARYSDESASPRHIWASPSACSISSTTESANSNAARAMPTIRQPNLRESCEAMFMQALSKGPCKEAISLFSRLRINRVKRRRRSPSSRLQGSSAYQRHHCTRFTACSASDSTGVRTLACGSPSRAPGRHLREDLRALEEGRQRFQHPQFVVDAQDLPPLVERQTGMGRAEGDDVADAEVGVAGNIEHRVLVHHLAHRAMR